MIHGWYYLHQNGSLLYKPETGSTSADIRESDFAVAMWPINPQDRASAWRVLVEAGALNADKERILYLSELWHCTDSDAQNYADRIGLKLIMDGNAWCARPGWFENLAISPAGFGDTCLHAMIDLCKQLEFKPNKIWPVLFSDLIKNNHRQNKVEI